MESKPRRTFFLTFEGKIPIRSGRVLEEVTLKEYLSRRHIMSSEKAEFFSATSDEKMGKPRVDGSLVGSIAEAFANHYHLEIRPDDVWLTIAIVFSNYVSQYSEEMREYLNIQSGLPVKIKSTDVPDDVCNVNEWMPKIDTLVKNLDQMVAEEASAPELGPTSQPKVGIKIPTWMIPDFTTTTPKDVFIGNLTVMGAVKRFINLGYKVACGIPGVTLHGEREDWVKLINKIHHIDECGTQARRKDLVEWCTILKRILKKFLDSYDGNVDNDFWQDCVVPSHGYTDFDYISGWALAFSPFSEGRWRLNSLVEILETGIYGKVDFADFSGGHSIEVPLDLEVGERKHNLIFYVGGLLCKYDKDRNVISPSFDVALLQVSVEVMNKKINSINVPNKNNGDGLRKSFGPVVLSELSKSSFPEGRKLPESISVGWHKHPLFLVQEFKRGHTCDDCRKPLVEVGGDGWLHITFEMQQPDYFNLQFIKYRCVRPQCDIDVCLDCHKKYV